MFGKISLGNFKSQAETVLFKLYFVDGRHVVPDDETWEPPVLHELSFGWTAGDGQDDIVKRLEAALQAPECWQDLAVLRILPVNQQQGLRPGFLVRAAGFHFGGGSRDAEERPNSSEVSVQLDVQRRWLTLYGLEVSSGSVGASDPALGSALETLPLSSLRWLRWGNPGAGALCRDPAILARLAPSLVRLDLHGAALGTLPPVLGTLRALRSLDVSGCGLKILPPALGALGKLQTLHADGNEISLLPGELARCSALRTLSLEGNRLTHVPLNFGALRGLRELDLFGNPLEVLPEIAACTDLQRLSVLNLRVSVLQPVRSKQEPCLDIMDTVPEVVVLKVELLPVPGQSYGIWGESRRAGDRLRPIFELMLRRSAGHHPLLAGALRHLALEDPRHRLQMARQEGALQQLLLMALADDERVAIETCSTLSLIAAHSPALAEAVAATDVAPILSLLESRVSAAVTVAALGVLSAVALSSSAAGARVVTPALLDALQRIVCGIDGEKHVLAAALEAVGNLCFGERALGALRARPALMAAVDRLAFVDKEEEDVGDVQASNTFGDKIKMTPVRAGAIRILAILGDNDAVQRAIGRPGPGPQPDQPNSSSSSFLGNRGIRILAMDGGGMKGLAAVRMLRELESRTGRQIHHLFDLVVGTSTGGLLAVALALRQLSLDECESIYKVLGRRVFSTAPPKDKEESWVDSVYRSLHSRTQHVRAVVVGYKHDSAMYESLLQEYCDLRRLPAVVDEYSGVEVASDASEAESSSTASNPGNSGTPPSSAKHAEHETNSTSRLCSTKPANPAVLGPALIDAAPLNAPRVALVATLASVTPAVPFIFRNYEFPPEQKSLFDALGAYRGSSRHAVWQAARASSAATYYLDGFECGGERFQDGAVTVNNPSLVALQEAQLLWPKARVEVLVSIGTGTVPSAPRPAAVSSFVETGAILIESATDVDRTADAVGAMARLIPDMHYFRFQPVDVRCGMALDEIRPEQWEALERATEEYVNASEAEWDAAAEALMKGLDNGQENNRESGRKLAAGGMSRGSSVLRLLRLAPTGRLIALECSQLNEVLQERGEAINDDGDEIMPNSAAPGAVHEEKQSRIVRLKTERVTCSSSIPDERTRSGSQHQRAEKDNGSDETHLLLDQKQEPMLDASAPNPSRLTNSDSPTATSENVPPSSGLSDYFSSWFSPTKAAEDGRRQEDAVHHRRKRPRSPTKKSSSSMRNDAEAVRRLVEAMKSLTSGTESDKPVIVLDLPVTSQGDNLVLGWTSTLVSIVSSSAQEDIWEERLGISMEEAFAEGPFVMLPDAPEEGLSCVSLHSQWVAGRPVQLRLLRHIYPAALLSAQQVLNGALEQALDGCLVVLLFSTRADAWVEALLRGASVSAVIQPSSQHGPFKVLKEHLCKSLLSGESLATILDSNPDLNLRVSCLNDRGAVSHYTREKG